MANIEFEFDLSKFAAALEGAADALEAGARLGLDEVLDEWVNDARNVAPIDKGMLRGGIQRGPIEGTGLYLTGTVDANRTERSRKGRRFNYAYYIHEGFAAKAGKRLRTPGTIEKFLEQPLKENESRYQAIVERAIEKELRKQGW